MNLKLNVRTVAREDVSKLRLGYLSTLTAWIRITILMRNFSFIQHFSRQCRPNIFVIYKTYRVQVVVGLTNDKSTNRDGAYDTIRDAILTCRHESA